MCQRFDKYDELAINLNDFMILIQTMRENSFLSHISSLIMLRLFTHMFDCFNSMFVTRDFFSFNVLIVMIRGMSGFQFKLIKSLTGMCDIDNELNRNHTYLTI